MEILQAKVGDLVRVRQRTWVVQDVDPFEHCRLLTLCGVDHTGAIRTCRVLHPFDDVDIPRRSRRLRRVGMRVWRRACRALIVEDGAASALRTAAAARIEMLPYQLEPAIALLRGLGSRLLLADEVGLGKTIQAMLAVAELRARGAARRMLVLCPAALRDQWVEECAARFRLPLAVLDQASLRRIRARLPIGVNPWSVEPLAVSSIDFVKRPEVLPAVLSASWDVVVVDEAHGACGQSDRGEAVARLCERASYVMLLTATPHNGDEQAFASLCAIGSHGDDLVVFRRSRLEAGRDAGRRVHTIRVAMNDAERRMHAALAALTHAIRRESTDTDGRIWLMLALLHKRALSSPFALAASAERRLRMLDREDDGSRTAQLLLPLDDDSGEVNDADAAPMWGAPALRDRGQERQLIEQLAIAAREAEPCSGKLRRLHRLLSAIREPAIVFTEYRDTLQHVHSQVVPHAAIVHGGMTREQRRAALARFPETPVLLATDAAGEGLNLHQQCRCVINLELPWNPMRLEQRIGRVDRIGQRRRVHAFQLVSTGTAETALLERLTARVSHARARVGTSGPFCGRPAWTEDASARFVVLNDEQPATEPPPEFTAPAVPLTRLTEEGHRESARICWMRRIVSADRAHAAAQPLHDTSSPPRAASASFPLAAEARRARLRIALYGRTAAVWRSTLVDAGGRTVATRIVGALHTDWRMPHPDGGTPHTSAEPSGEGPAPWAAYREWHDDSCRTHERMTRLRLHRAYAIAALHRQARGELQPGLFDRRTEHAWQARADEEDAALTHARDRIVQAEAALRFTATAPELVLVLSPHTEVSRP